MAHFVCHRRLETGKSFDTSFQLHWGTQLTLVDIMRTRLPNAEFAFLSCCHTAELTEESIADEALHLTITMLYCGFQSVVTLGRCGKWTVRMGGTWPRTSTSRCSEAERQVCHITSDLHERWGILAARKLRRSDEVTLDQWMNFIMALDRVFGEWSNFLVHLGLGLKTALISPQTSSGSYRRYCLVGVWTMSRSDRIMFPVRPIPPRHLHLVKLVNVRKSFLIVLVGEACEEARQRLD